MPTLDLTMTRSDQHLPLSWVLSEALRYAEVGQLGRKYSVHISASAHTRTPCHSPFLLLASRALTHMPHAIRDASNAPLQSMGLAEKTVSRMELYVDVWGNGGVTGLDDGQKIKDMT